MEIYAVFEWGGDSFRMIAAHFDADEAREAAWAAFACHVREAHGAEARGLPPAMGEVLRCGECEYGVVALTLERD